MKKYFKGIAVAAASIVLFTSCGGTANSNINGEFSGNVNVNLETTTNRETNEYLSTNQNNPFLMPDDLVINSNISIESSQNAKLFGD
ncbi:MAG: hypothetical protein ACK4NC_03750 [Candidatus Gracilibacteria bacterium]